MNQTLLAATLILSLLLSACASAPDNKPVGKPPAASKAPAPYDGLAEEPWRAPRATGAVIIAEQDDEGMRLEMAAQAYQRTLEAMFVALKDELDACYLPQLKRNPNLAGYVIVEFKVLKGGKIGTGPTVTSTSLNNNKVETCLINLISAQNYPEPFNGKYTDVKRRFDFGIR